MKTIITLALVLASSGAFAAQTIECKVDGRGGSVVTIARVDHSSFILMLDESLATPYVAIEDETVTMESNTRADVLSAWNGNWGEKLSFRKGFLSQRKGAKSRAFVKAEYHDIEDDVNSSVVECEVVE